MGAAAPPIARGSADELDRLEDGIKDAILQGDTSDKILNILIDLTLEAEQQGRSLFPNPMAEPYFYGRYIKKWIMEGVNERIAVENTRQQLVKP